MGQQKYKNILSTEDLFNLSYPSLAILITTRSHWISFFIQPGDWVQICSNHKRWTTSLLHHSLYVSPTLPFSAFHEPSPRPHSQKPVRFWETLISRMYKWIWSTHSIVEEVHCIYTLSLSSIPSFHFFYIHVALIMNRLRVRHKEELVLL